MEIAARTAPLVGFVVLLLVWGRGLSGLLALVVGLILVAAVLAAVHHAEVVAHRVGSPTDPLCWPWRSR